MKPKVRRKQGRHSEVGYAIKSDSGGFIEEDNGYGWQIVCYPKLSDAEAFCDSSCFNTVSEIVKVRITEI